MTSDDVSILTANNKLHLQFRYHSQSSIHRLQTMIFLTRHLVSLSCWKCLLLLAFVPSVFALLQRETPSNSRVPSRREFVSKAIPTFLLASSLDAKPAFALRERNEALCGTGFFTNIGKLSRTSSDYHAYFYSNNLNCNP
jgi:hypothetical protein